MTQKYRLAAAAFVFAGIALAARAQDAAPPPLYTDAQAQAGATVYGQACATCHGAALDGTSAPALKGPAFHDMAAAQSLTVDGLLSVTSLTMPQSDPGTLTADQYNQVVAYLLQQNGLPSGTVPLAPGAPHLKDVLLK